LVISDAGLGTGAAREAESKEEKIMLTGGITVLFIHIQGAATAILGGGLLPPPPFETGNEMNVYWSAIINFQTLKE
jgi:hypothetical protein